ncbi:glyoxylase-like metal-dependent hydrolase (beta-lactamase superfamily II) [Bacillus fengqiuensis]|nr:glyoxylase-like metal-dependent hydrolase (beta-lactamase superfamily II) [Bacillus fengqiuensis]
MKYQRVPLGPLQTNCYIIENDKKECLIVDPGEEGRKLVQLMEQRKLTPVAVLLTHAHFDHIGALDDVRKRYELPVYVHVKEKDWLTDPALNGSQFFMMGAISVQAATHHLTKEGPLTIGDFTCEVYETPGHSPGSVSYYFKEAGIVASGDVLFEGSIGRTDLQGGSHEQLLQSIHKKLLVLPEDTIVLCGHGRETNIGDEMESNPFLNGF